MSRLIAAFVMAAGACAAAHAAPAQDDLGQLMRQKSIASRIGDALHESTSRATEIVMNAMSALDTPYHFGGTSRLTGFDCSGFVQAMVKQSAGLLLPRSAAEQARATESIQKDQLRPGDLVFFNTMRRAFSHVGIYIGEGKFIHAPRTGAQVRVESMDVSYWQARFNGARRVALGGSDADDAQQPASAARSTPAASSSVIDRDSPAPTTVRLGGSSQKPESTYQVRSGENI
ncbi:C40 family peptidase [Ottowia sp.]|uniref:C40 family peptidase n=1 Tax=Ottowia sp. TaxID=1898956 RepID=UPI00345E142E